MAISSVLDNGCDMKLTVGHRDGRPIIALIKVDLPIPEFPEIATRTGGGYVGCSIETSLSCMYKDSESCSGSSAMYCEILRIVAEAMASA